MKAEYITKEWLYERVIERDGCLIWQGCVGCNGTQPQAKFNGKTENVRRLVWSMKHQRKVPDGLRVGVTCENELCLEPKHIVARKNGALLAGRKQGHLQIAKNADGQRAKSKLQQDDVKKILDGEVGPDEFVEKHGMSKSYFYRILSGEFRRDYSNNPFAGLGQ